MRQFMSKKRLIIAGLYSFLLLSAVSLNSCDGKGDPGAPGKSVAIDVHDSASASFCPDGGVQVDAGIDDDDDKALDLEEVDCTQYICYGATGTSGTNGLNALVAVTTEPAGDNCSTGGKMVSVGLDANANNVLDFTETTSSDYICNGADGAYGTNGTDGLNSLMTIVSEPIGTNCANGGIKVTSGLDANANEVLEDEEATSASYVCKGDAGTTGDDATSCMTRPGEDIQACVDSILNSGGGAVTISAGTYTISRYIHIWAGNLILQGEGAATKIFLAEGAQTSNIAIGNIEQVNPDEDASTAWVENIVVRDLWIDGNMDSQPSDTTGEKWKAPYEYINVSGITVRKARNVTITNVTVRNARSAGILVEKSTEGFLLDDVDVQNSFFDGFSCNKSYRGNVVNSLFSQNAYAGITATCDCSDNIISNSDISYNGLGDHKEPGIYLADAHRNHFSDNMIAGNGDVGIKLTGADCGMPGSTGASLNYFANNNIVSNQSCGVYLDTADPNGGPGAGNKALGTFYYANVYNGVCNYDAAIYEEISPIIVP